MESNRHIEEQEDVLNQLSLNKIILPVAIGVVAIVLMLLSQFNVEEFNRIQWNSRLWTYLGIAVLIYILRHVFYSYRLKILSDDQFTFKHSVELVTIWEFASAISPTSIGGSAVAVFFLSQEKISAAKAVSIVLYTVIIDTIFFLISIIGLYIIFGPKIVDGGLTNLMSGAGITLIIVWLFMFCYGGLLLWGLYRPRIIKRMLMFVGSIPLIRRFRRNLYQIGEDVVVTSKELRNKSLGFHIKATLLTIGAWATRFLTVNFVILALVEMDWQWWEQFLIYSRSEIMYVITQFSPTPGGSGVMEFFFPKFFNEYVSQGIGSLGALLWRIITYYPYLIIGAIIIPNWIRRVIKQKRSKA